MGFFIGPQLLAEFGMASVTIYYDSECPFCQNYLKLIKLKENLGEVHLISLREKVAVAQSFKARGLDPDEGMIVQYEGREYYGSEAINFLAKHSSSENRFSILNKKLFSASGMARFFYPMMKAGRNLTLFLLGRTKISFDSEFDASLKLLGFVFGVFLLLHFAVYATQFNAPLYLSTFLIPLLGVAFICKPSERRLWLLVIPLLLIDAVMQMPSFSNHTVLKNFFLSGACFLGVYSWLSGKGWNYFQPLMMGIGRQLLLIMYFFGVFHKLNTDFFNLETSCAVALWQEMAWPLNLIDVDWFYQLSIYGALVIEALIVLCLLTKNLRHFGIVIGIAFHVLLGMSGYALYPPFSTLTIFLHICFIDEPFAKKILHSETLKSVLSKTRLLSVKAILFLAFVSLGISAWVGTYAYFGLVWAILLVPFWVVIFKAAWRSPSSERIPIILKPLGWNLVGIMFFLNCAAPYAGLKTAQTMSMFANLHLEGGRSNHLVFSNPPAPFGYLEDTVRVTETSGIPYLSYIKSEDLSITYYTLLHYLDINPGRSVSFTRGGENYRNMTAQSLETDIDRTLHAPWFRRFFHFSPIDSTQPKPCALDR